MRPPRKSSELGVRAGERGWVLRWPCPGSDQEAPFPGCTWRPHLFNGRLPQVGPELSGLVNHGQQERVPGREGGGGAYDRPQPGLGPPIPFCPGAGPGAMSSGSSPCPAVSAGAAANAHTSTPGRHRTPPPSPPQFPLPPPSPCGTATQGVASGLQTTGSKPLESVPLK